MYCRYSVLGQQRHAHATHATHATQPPARPTVSDLEVHRACLCAVWVKCIDLVPLVIDTLSGTGKTAAAAPAFEGRWGWWWWWWWNSRVSDGRQRGHARRQVRGRLDKYVTWVCAVPAYVLYGLNMLIQYPLYRHACGQAWSPRARR